MKYKSISNCNSKENETEKKCTNSITNMKTEKSKCIFYRCDGINCRKRKGKLLEHYIKKYKLTNNIEIQKMGCSDRCNKAPVLHLHPDDIWFSEKDLGNVFKKYILNK